MNQEDFYSPDNSTWISLSLLWDGIYNIDSFGKMIIPPICPINHQQAFYDCTRRWLKIHARYCEREQISDAIGCENIAVRIGHDAGKPSSDMAIDFTPYEQMLVIPIQISGIEQINALMLRIYRSVLGDIGNENCLVYQEILERFEISSLQTIKTLVLQETHSDFSNRIANYWGVEDFANWYHHTYNIEIWISTIRGAFRECNGFQYPKPKVGYTVNSRIIYEFGNGLTNQDQSEQARHGENREAIEGVINIFENLTKNQIVACDHLNYNYNFERRKDYFKWLSDFSRVQRLLRNKNVFFDYLRHIEDYLKARPNAELLEALEIFEYQACFPTTQAIPIGVLSSSCFSELVTRAYAIYDVGVRSCHGGLTHRLQWHAIIHLMTNRHTTAIAQGFYHSALELYCVARSTLFKTTNRLNAGFKIDLWRFLFDRFDKYAMKDSPQSALVVDYPEQYEDDLHYADQAYMTLMDLPNNPRVTEKFIMELGTQMGKITSTSIYISNLLDSNNVVPSRLHNWIERYLIQLELPSSSDYAVTTTDERLIWGCLVSSDEWAEIDAKLESLRMHTHNITRIASKLRSFFFEAVVSVRVVSELYRTPELIPETSPHRQTILKPFREDQPIANLFEEVAPYIRILSLLRQVSRDGQPLFLKMTDNEGNSIECLKQTNAISLSQKTIDTLKFKSRMSLQRPKTDTWITKGIAFL